MLFKFAIMCNGCTCLARAQLNGPEWKERAAIGLQAACAPPQARQFTTVRRSKPHALVRAPVDQKRFVCNFPFLLNTLNNNTSNTTSWSFLLQFQYTIKTPSSFNSPEQISHNGQGEFASRENPPSVPMVLS